MLYLLPLQPVAKDLWQFALFITDLAVVPPYCVYHLQPVQSKMTGGKVKRFEISWYCESKDI